MYLVMVPQSSVRLMLYHHQAVSRYQKNESSPPSENHEMHKKIKNQLSNYNAKRFESIQTGARDGHSHTQE